MNARRICTVFSNLLKPYCDFFGVVASFNGVVLSFNEFSSKSLALAFETFLFGEATIRLSWIDFKGLLFKGDDKGVCKTWVVFFLIGLFTGETPLSFVSVISRAFLEDLGNLTSLFGATFSSEIKLFVFFGVARDEDLVFRCLKSKAAVFGAMSDFKITF